MTDERFDTFARALGGTKSRRDLLRVAAGGVLGGVAAVLGFGSNAADASILCNPKVTPCRQLFRGVCTPCADLGKYCDPNGQCVYSCQGCTHLVTSTQSCVAGCAEGSCCDNGDNGGICRPLNQRCQTANAEGFCVTCTNCNPDGTCPKTCTGCTHLDPNLNVCVPGCATGNCCNSNTNTCVPTPRCSTADSSGHCVTCAQNGTCCQSNGTCAPPGGCLGADANGNCASCQTLGKCCAASTNPAQQVCVETGATCACATCSNGTCQKCSYTPPQAPVCCFNPSNAGGICILLSQSPNGNTCISADGSCGCTTGCCNTTTGTCVPSASQCPAPGCSFTTGDGRCQCGCPSGQVCTNGTCTTATCGEAAGQPCCGGTTCDASKGLFCYGGNEHCFPCSGTVCGNVCCGCNGYTCQSGVCQPLCNPACPAGTHCAGDGQGGTVCLCNTGGVYCNGVCCPIAPPYICVGGQCQECPAPPPGGESDVYGNTCYNPVTQDICGNIICAANQTCSDSPTPPSNGNADWCASCVNCGARGQVCCDGTCNTGLSCNSSNICQ